MEFQIPDYLNYIFKFEEPEFKPSLNVLWKYK